jgi:hypothetical protein
MSKPWWTVGSLLRHDANWRPPTDPAKILPERRKPAPVNRYGFGETRTVNDLTPAERVRYETQLAAFLAANDLTILLGNTAQYGMPVPRGAVRTWTNARRRWTGVRTAHTPERTTR